MVKKFLYIFMCRYPHLWANMICKYLKENNRNIIIISDQEYNKNIGIPVIYYSDKKIFDANMHKFDYCAWSKKTPTAWDKALYHLYLSETLPGFFR